MKLILNETTNTIHKQGIGTERGGANHQTVCGATNHVAQATTNRYILFASKILREITWRYQCDAGPATRLQHGVGDRFRSPFITVHNFNI